MILNNILQALHNKTATKSNLLFVAFVTTAGA
jgi:hypothetical protein